jgi:hypothetical protein
MLHTNNATTDLQYYTQLAFRYLDDRLEELNDSPIPSDRLTVMLDWHPKQDPRFLDMGTGQVTLYAYPSRETFAVTGTADGSSVTYVVEGLKYALLLVEYLANDSIYIANLLKGPR